ncbi:molybdopterin-dependent oxidoreductase, partial [Beggiatoa alba]|nr:molybdopterin-dependent oxidoreductase [Beggiatoa alba]
SSDVPSGLEALLSNIEVDETHEKIARYLLDAETATVILGHDAIAHSHFASLRAITGQIAELTSSKLSYLSDGCNSAGAFIAGAIPHRGSAGADTAIRGKNLSEMFDSGLAGYILLGLEPEEDCADSSRALKALEAAEFVVVMNAFSSDKMKEYADVILPITPFTETSGTFVNAEGRWQSFEAVVEPLGDARPAWKVLRVLGNLFDCDGFEYVTSIEVRDELKALASNITLSNDMKWQCPATLSMDSTGIESITDRSMYCSDGLVRRASSLQEVVKAHQMAIRVNQTVATSAGLTGGEPAIAKKNNIELTLPLVIDDRVPDDSVLVPGAAPESLIHGTGTGKVTLSRV